MRAGFAATPSCAAGNVGSEELRPALERHAAGDDELLREHAEWALARLDDRSA